MSEILVVCRKCQSKAPSSVMRLDVDEKMMICPNCVKSKTAPKKLSEVMNSPKAETEHTMTFSRPSRPGVESADKIKQKCRRCQFEFKVNLETKTPKYCPYCNAPVFGLY
jgi:protein-arginine kinase activator protein McsA